VRRRIIEYLLWKLVHLHNEMEGNIIINSVGLKGIQDGVRGMKVA
jgi:hypothetical protein